jgi:hypothetical protein
LKNIASPLQCPLCRGLLSLAVQEEPEIAERPRASISRETEFRVDSSSDSNL